MTAAITLLGSPSYALGIFECTGDLTLEVEGIKGRKVFDKKNQTRQLIHESDYQILILYTKDKKKIATIYPWNGIIIKKTDFGTNSFTIQTDKESWFSVSNGAKPRPAGINCRTF